tara:strand:+ start:1245 stop:1976 length:732 start_codon:yes stop_codon:yes gene_type:complete
MRIISRLDIKNEFVIKGINFEGLRKIGDPSELSEKYYKDKADELILYDAVASLYGRNNMFHIVEKITKNIFIPVCLGGGIRTLEDIKMALESGADKVAINTAFIKNPKFLKEATENFGVSNIIASIEAKKISENEWEAYIHNGRDKTGLMVNDWIKKIQDIGCGEILLTSVDNEGTQSGFDLNLLNYIKTSKINVPIIFSGGCGKFDHVKSIYKFFSDEAIAIASALHYNKLKIVDIKKQLKI